MVAAVLAPLYGAMYVRKDSPMKTIAVLPFTNVSRDPAQDYLVDGLTDELIGALSKLRALRVVARAATRPRRFSGSRTSETRQ